MDDVPRLTNISTGAYSLVDEDIRQKYKESSIWRHSAGYIYIKDTPLSHLVIGGRPPIGFVVDHENRIRNDNRRSNLRVISNSDNSQNRAGRGKSKYKNVNWNSEKSKWCVSSSKDYISKCVGYFDVEEHAAYHANLIMKDLYGSSANLNKSSEGEELSKPEGYDEVIAAQNARRNRDLPKCISKHRDGFQVRMMVNRRRFLRRCKTLDVAIDAVTEIKKEAEAYKASLVPAPKYVIIKETTKDYLTCLTSNGVHEFKISPHRYDSIKGISWHLNSGGYIIQTNTKKGLPAQLLHRYLLSATPGSVVDHIDGDRKNNVDENIRLVTHAQNAQNKRTNGKSGYMGVKINKSGKFTAFITYQRVLMFLGTYPTITLAAWVYNQVATRFYGPNCGKNNDIEDYSDRYQIQETINLSGNHCLRAIPLSTIIPHQVAR